MQRNQKTATDYIEATYRGTIQLPRDCSRHIDDNSTGYRRPITSTNNPDLGIFFQLPRNPFELIAELEDFSLGSD